MAIKTNRGDREYRKFKESTSQAGQVGVVVLNPDGSSVGNVTGLSTTTGDGRKTVASAGTAEALAASTACKSVTFTALLSNTGTVVVGGSTVVASAGTRRGVPLNAGDSLSIDVSNLNAIYLDVTVNGEGVSYAYIS